MIYGLLGHPLSHSFSKEIHESIADYRYDIMDLTLDEFHEFMKKKEFAAVNVTIPYKETVIPYIDVIDGMARDIGAVNTVVNRGGKLYGYNTDIYGLSELILRNIDTLEDKTVLILGSGGTAKTATYVSRMLGAKKIYIASRNPSGDDHRVSYISYGELDGISGEVSVIINTTPVGMYPNIFAKPIEISKFPALECVIDAIYNPLSTSLVSEAKRMGIASEGGLYMLVSQAVRAVEHFLDTTLDTSSTEKALMGVVMKRRNTVLVGMPGCGKSSVGKKIAESMGREFFDTDEEIAKSYGSPADLIREKGEAAFRDIESEVIRSLASKNGAVIATGGGAVLRSENVEALKMNGILVFLDRSPDAILPTPDRPLSCDREKLMRLYSERYEKYISAADIKIAADGTVDAVAESVAAKIETIY